MSIDPPSSSWWKEQAEGWKRHAQTSDREVTELRRKLHDCEDTLSTYAHAAETAEADLARERERTTTLREALHGDLAHSVTHLFNQAVIALQDGERTEASARLIEARDAHDALLGELAALAASLPADTQETT